MILKRIKVNVGTGEETNCYIILDEKTKETIVIDPGGESEKIVEMIKTLDAKVKYIYVTHCHGDHIGGVQQLKSSVGGQIISHKKEEEGLKNQNISLTYIVGIDDINIEADSRLNDEDLLHIGEIEFKVIYTPGHTIGGSCLYCKQYNMLFTGDTLFRGTWGRTDLPTGSFEDIIKSITNKIMILPEDTIIYPGHGKSSILKEEETIYLNLKGKEI